MPIRRLALVAGLAFAASLALAPRAHPHAFAQASAPPYDSDAVGGCAALAVGSFGLLGRLRRR